MYEVKKNMNTKLIVALVIVGVLAVAVVGLVSAQIATSTPYGTASTTPNNGFFGWIGNCFRFRSTGNYGTQSQIASNLPANITVTDPNTSITTTYQGYVGYGRCMGFRP
jgi:hypothetical protein